MFKTTQIIHLTIVLGTTTVVKFFMFNQSENSQLSTNVCTTAYLDVLKI